MNNYTDEQQKDILSRMQIVNQALIDNQLDLSISFVDKKYAQNNQNVENSTTDNTGVPVGTDSTGSNLIKETTDGSNN